MMNRIVANLARGIAHAQRNAENVPDEEHDQRRPDDVPADNEKSADDLKPDLLAIAIDGTTRVGQAEGCAAGGCGEEAGSDASNECADKVRVEDIEGVVDMLEQCDVAFAEVEANLMDGLALCSREKGRKLTQGMVPDPSPRQIAPQPATTPAAGVIATSPVIMP
jgi:hypothetical protein